MKTPNQTASSPALPDGWNRPRPEHQPRPTICPAILSLGATLLFWGLITSAIITTFGLGLLTLGVTLWIQEVRYERRQHS